MHPSNGIRRLAALAQVHPFQMHPLFARVHCIYRHHLYRVTRGFAITYFMCFLTSHGFLFFFMDEIFFIQSTTQQDEHESTFEWKTLASIRKMFHGILVFSNHCFQFWRLRQGDASESITIERNMLYYIQWKYWIWRRDGERWEPVSDEAELVKF